MELIPNLNARKLYPEWWIRENISHYTQRLQEAKTVNEKAFVRCQLWRYKQLLKMLLN